MTCKLLFEAFLVDAPKPRKKYFRPIRFLIYSAKEVSSVNRQKKKENQNVSFRLKIDPFK